MLAYVVLMVARPAVIQVIICCVEGCHNQIQVINKFLFYKEISSILN